jgi:hypothetical protein
MINLNDTVPSAPSGGRNVKFQQDSSGNVSAYTSLSTVKTVVTPVAGVITLDCSLGNSFRINVNAAITSATVTNQSDGQEITLLFVQDVTGHAVTLPAAFLGSFSITTTANKRSCYKWSYDTTTTNWYQVGANNQ